MYKYLIRRLLLAVVTIFGVTVVIFIAMRVLPGDPLAMLYSESTGIYVLSEAELAATRASLGLDDPLYLQYLNWMADVAKGDLGYSFWVEVPIMDTIIRRGPITAEIALIAILLAWAIGVPVGVISAIWRESLLDHILRFLVTLFMAVPSFWLGLTMILFTVLVLNWRPSITIEQVWINPPRQPAHGDRPCLRPGHWAGRHYRPHDTHHGARSAPRRLRAHGAAPKGFPCGRRSCAMC